MDLTWLECTAVTMLASDELLVALLKIVAKVKVRRNNIGTCDSGKPVGCNCNSYF